MASKDPTCALFVGFFIGLGLIYAGVKNYQLLQKINNTPTSKVSSAAVGLVELFGKMRSTSNVISPFKKVPCGYWCIVGQYYRPGKHGGWFDIYRKSSEVMFYLEDETGKMLINPLLADITIPADVNIKGTLSNKGLFGTSKASLPQDAIAFIDSLPEPDKKKFYDKSAYQLRIYEYYIAEKDPLYVMGTATPRGGFSSAVGHENLVVHKGNDTFYIRDSDEKTVRSKISSSYLWQLIAGLIISAICLFFLLTRFGL